MRRALKRINKFKKLVENLGFAPLSEERMVRAIESQRSRIERKRQRVNPYAGCASVTSVARDLGIKRNDLFKMLTDIEWLHRTPDGWRAIDDAIDDGWVVQRGSAVMTWPQITLAGRSRIQRMLDASPPSVS